MLTAGRFGMLLLLAAAPPSGKLVRLHEAPFAGEIQNSTQLSALARVGPYLLTAADEGAHVVVLQPEGAGYRVHGPGVPLPQRGGAEIDLEALAAEGDVVYALGSHSWKRLRLKSAASAPANASALGPAAPEPSRDRLFRFRLNQNGEGRELEESSLRDLVEKHPLLKAFAHIPGKENGVDFEGIAVRNGRLYVGCRGPLLRDNWSPILSFRFEPGQIKKADTLFVKLGGLGVRDMAAVKDGFLIVAGPVGSGPGGSHLYLWNGRDCMPGVDPQAQPEGRCEHLAEIPCPRGGKAEGLLPLEEAADHLDLLIVYDGVPGGGATVFRLMLPAAPPSAGSGAAGGSRRPR